MSSAILSQCISRISAIATRLQELHKETLALELQQCLEDLLEVQQQQQAQARSRYEQEQAFHKSQLCSRLAHFITTGRIYGLSLDQIMGSSLRQIYSAFPKWRITYTTIDVQSQLTVIQSIEPQDMPTLTGFRVDLTVASEYLTALRRGTPVIVEDVANAPILAPLAEVMATGGIQAVLDVPLKPCRNLVGLLCWDSPCPHQWSEHEIGTLIEIADYLSYALQELYANQERRKSEAALHEANRDLQQYAKQLEAANHEIEMSLEELRRGNEQLTTAYQEIEQQRRRYQDLFNLAPDGYLVTDAWGNIQEANQAARILLAAWDDQQILGTPLSRFIPLKERRGFQTQLNQFIKLRQLRQFEINLNSRQGTSFSVEMTVRAIEEGQDEQVKLLWLIRDISDKKRAELALQQLNEQLEQRVQQRTADLREVNVQLQAEIADRIQLSAERSRLIAILDASADFIGIATSQGNILWNNPQLKKIRGLTPDTDVTRLKLADYHPQWAVDLIEKQGFPAAIRDGVWMGETALLDTNNQEIPVSQMIIAHKSAEGIVDYLSTVMRDISDVYDELRLRKAAELSLRAVSDRLQYVLTSSPAVIFSCPPDRAQTATFISQNVSTILGFEVEEFLNSSQFWVKRVHPDDLEKIQTNFSQLFECEVYSYEYRFLHADGTYHWLSTQLRLVKDEAGNPREWVGYLIDITDKKLAEEKLRETQQHLQAILDYSPAAIYVITRDNKHLLVNRHYETLVSATQESLIGNSIDQVWPTEFCEVFAVNNQQILQSGKPMEFEEVAPHADGVHTYITIKFPLYDANGVAYAVCGISADITDKKRAEEELQTSQHLIQKIADSSPNLLYLYDLEEQRNVYVNREVTQMLGYTPEEIQAMGQGFLSILMHPDDLKVTPKKMKQIDIACDGEVIEFEYRMRHKNGEWRWIYSWDTVFLRTSEGKPKQILGTATDISDRKLAEARIQASLQEKEVLLREIHHRVKNNLQVIHSLLRLQSSYTDDPKTLQMFQESQNRIRSMALIHELLYQSQDLARIDFGSYIETLVKQLARTYSISTNTISWKICVEPRDIQIGIDTALPCGLLINELVSNALKYAFPQEQPGQIKISLRACNNEEFTLVISDNGVGIPSHLDFRQTDSLGLQLVCGTTGQIGGTIELDRTQGTTFTIRFKEIKYKPRR